MKVFATMSLEPIKDDVIVSQLNLEKGYLYPPDTPGLGVELNERILKSKITPGKKLLVCEMK
jgi:L-alanine-DL-glutamate epimerase-like enolase superfamily enzyme